MWHPYGALPAALAPLPVVSAQGVRLRLADGRELIDGMASWWCAIHGYRHPALDARRARAARADGARDVRRAHARARRAPGGAPDASSRRTGLERVFFADSGSVSVEVAIKLCLQYQRARGRAGRTRLLTVAAATTATRPARWRVCDPVGGMHSLFAGLLPEHVFAERPPDGFDAGLDAALGRAACASWRPRTRDELAAVIVEPVVQGAGGMRFHSPECVALLRDAVRRARPAAGARRDRDRLRAHGRAVRVRARRASRPDVMCVGKALTGGYMTLAATLCTRRGGRRPSPAARAAG